MAKLEAMLFGVDYESLKPCSLYVILIVLMKVMSILNRQGYAYVGWPPCLGRILEHDNIVQSVCPNTAQTVALYQLQA